MLGNGLIGYTSVDWSLTSKYISKYPVRTPAFFISSLPSTSNSVFPIELVPFIHADVASRLSATYLLAILPIL